MSRDLNQIFDLATLRRAWGDGSSPATATEESLTILAPPESPPLRLAGELQEALNQEFTAAETQQLFAPTLAAIGGLLAEAADMNHEELSRRFDELEDLFDALSLPSPGPG
jgi:hypothetical protein